MMNFNVNDKVCVKLTSHGKAIMANRGFPYKPEPDGWVSFHLWVLMEIFGPYMGDSLPFEADIRLEGVT